MRLLHSLSLEFENIEGKDVPQYAILSHTWGNEEVSFKEMQDGPAPHKAGYRKIKKCGEIAWADGYKFFWVDTCCIDKSSSAELAEAINSMYNLYRNATVCYAYLSDVATGPAEGEYPNLNDSAFKASRWFTRGWTLQELLAPSRVDFFSKDWERIGTKASLKERIAKITSIDIEALEEANLAVFSVSERMSWAAGRETSRVEDIAYSLMGIFDVNMPLLYGEGVKSFTRLQEEILKSSDDHTLFAWKKRTTHSEEFVGLLASSPDDFADSGSFYSRGVWGKSELLSMTNKGLHVELFLVPHREQQHVYYACLDSVASESFTCSPAIYLQRISQNGQFARIHANAIDILDPKEKMRGKYTKVFVKQDHMVPYHQSRRLGNRVVFQIRSPKTPIDAFPSGHWDPQTQTLLADKVVGKVGWILFLHQNLHIILILGLSQRGDPWCKLIAETNLDPDAEWNSFTPNGTELPKCRVTYSPLEARPIRATASVLTGTMYRRPVLIVAVDILHEKKWWSSIAGDEH